jgi:cysteine desulfurase
MTKQQIYMDHASTTYTDPQVLKAMLPYFSEKYGNPESLHTKGKEALIAIDSARKTTAKILNCRSSEVIFCGTATEANNLAIFGTARANKALGNHLITTKIEHSSISEPFKQLEREGFKVTYLDVDKEGFVSPKDVRSSITPKTTLISIMYANNEIGTIEPIKKIGTLIAQAKSAGQSTPYFHTDACQIAGVASLDTQALNLDLMTLNGSKIYGPKGVGVLYVKRGTVIKPIIYGGTHEYNLRGGTHNTANIVGFAKALELITTNSKKECTCLTILRDKLINGLLKNIPNSHINGPNISSSKRLRLPNNINITIPGINAQEVLLHLDEAGIFASTGAVCRVGTEKPSNVLKSIGLPKKHLFSTFRFTIGKQTSLQDINYVIKILTKIVKKLT